MALNSTIKYKVNHRTEYKQVTCIDNSGLVCIELGLSPELILGNITNGTQSWCGSLNNVFGNQTITETKKHVVDIEWEKSGGRNPPAVDQVIPVWVSGLAFHNVRLRSFVCQRYSRHLTNMAVTAVIDITRTTVHRYNRRDEESGHANTPKLLRERERQRE